MTTTNTDLIAIVNAQIVTVDESATVIENGTIVVKQDGSIGKIGAGRVDHDAKEIVDAGGSIVMPGLINAHTHLGMTLFRGLGDDMSLEA
ncbi:MAG: hypothetical protein ACKO2E_07600, partial [Actinomycetota bacterium]